MTCFLLTPLLAGTGTVLDQYLSHLLQSWIQTYLTCYRAGSKLPSPVTELDPNFPHLLQSWILASYCLYSTFSWRREITCKCFIIPNVLNIIDVQLADFSVTWRTSIKIIYTVRDTVPYSRRPDPKDPHLQEKVKIFKLRFSFFVYKCLNN